MTLEYLNLPIDSTAQQLLAGDGLRFELLDQADPVAFATWSQAVSRGFLGAAEPDDKIEKRRSYFGARRMCGVWDDSAADSATPVATIDSWTSDLTVPGGRSVPAWAISAVAVTSTHRRRGIARALMEAELRTAAASNIPVAMLTVSESTIYGRFGFAPSAMARDLTIDTRRAIWTGPEVTGRVQLVTQQQLLTDGHGIVERERLGRPGQIEYSGILWDRLLGVTASDDDARALRFARYDDDQGIPQGFAIYRFKENASDFTEHELTVHLMETSTDEAYAGLWRFLLETDLTTKVTAELRPLDEPFRWMVSDFRSLRTSDYDHLWVRILDVRRALEARTYATPGRIVIGVSDPLGFADGTWELDVAADGSATVTKVSEQPDVSLSVNALGAIYLGGVSATMLAGAGRITGDAVSLEAVFRSDVAPWLSIWF